MDWERTVLAICKKYLPEGRYSQRNGLHVWQPRDAVDATRTVKWFRIGRLHHLGIDHATTVTAVMAKIMQLATMDVFLRYPEERLAMNLEREVPSVSFVVDHYGYPNEVGMPLADAGLIAAIATAANWRRAAAAGRQLDLVINAAEGDPAERFAELCRQFPDGRPLEFFIEREREWATGHFGRDQKCVFDAVLRMLMEDICVDPAVIGEVMNREAGRELPNLERMPYTLVHEPERAGPYEEVALAEWDMRNASASESNIKLAEEMVTLNISGSDHSGAYLSVAQAHARQMTL